MAKRTTAKKAPAKKAPAKKAPAKRKAPANNDKFNEYVRTIQSQQATIVDLKKQLASKAEEISNLNKGVRKLEENRLTEVKPLQDKIKELQLELGGESKLNLTTEELVALRENIRLEVMEEVRAELMLMASHADPFPEDLEEPVKKVENFMPKPEFKDEEGHQWQLVSNQAGHKGAWDQRTVNLHQKLMSAQQIETMVIELPEDNQLAANHPQAADKYFLYKSDSHTVAVKKQTTFKTEENGKGNDSQK
jgi:hypothetical protein